MLKVGSNRILNIYKSRINLLSQLNSLGYKTTEYEGFSINEIDAMFVHSQLDMLVHHPTTDRKVYVTYYMNVNKTAKQIKADSLDKIIEDLMIIDTVLTKEDTLVVVLEEELNESMQNRLRYLYEHDGIFVVIVNVRRLLFNILNHQLIPKTTVLTPTETETLKKDFHLATMQQLPEISRFDPLAMAVLLRPGDVCCCWRKSQTALSYKYYRVCI